VPFLFAETGQKMKKFNEYYFFAKKNG